jgi:hypothetical protein
MATHEKHAKNLFAVDKAFEQDEIEKATDEELRLYLYGLCNRAPINPYIGTRDTVRGITLNNVQMARFIQRLDESNKKLTHVVIVLTIVAILVGIAQIWAALGK